MTGRFPGMLRARTLLAATFAGGLVAGAVGGVAVSRVEGPSAHRGLDVAMLGAIPPASMAATTGLEGYRLQLRAITIAPGGQIARHGHADRPGLVKVVSGAWVEGRPDGETTFTAAGDDAVVEDETTTHWFFNRGDTPATAIVCDVQPEA